MNIRTTRELEEQARKEIGEPSFSPALSATEMNAISYIYREAAKRRYNELVQRQLNVIRDTVNEAARLTDSAPDWQTVKNIQVVMERLAEGDSE